MKRKSNLKADCRAGKQNEERKAAEPADGNERGVEKIEKEFGGALADEP